MPLKSPEQILKELAIEKWKKGGLERPVKVVSAGRGALSNVRGYITQEKNIKGQSLAEIETRLGRATHLYQPDRDLFRLRCHNNCDSNRARPTPSCTGSVCDPLLSIDVMRFRFRLGRAISSS